MAATVTILHAPFPLTPAERAQLVTNGMASLSTDSFDPPPVVRLTSQALGTVWYLTEMDPFGSGDIAFGLCDQGDGCADLACIDLDAITRAYDRSGFRTDPTFRASGPLSDYLARARRPLLRTAF